MNLKKKSIVISQDLHTRLKAISHIKYSTMEKTLESILQKTINSLSSSEKEAYDKFIQHSEETQLGND